MNTKLLACLVLLAGSFYCTAQNKQMVAVFYGISDSELLRNEEVDGLAGTDNSNTYEFGISYELNLTDRFAITTGVTYTSTDVTFRVINYGGAPIKRTEGLSLFSVPVYAKYSFGKYVFVDGGPLIAFQEEKNSFDTQTGVGLGVGVGGKYTFQHWQVFVHPNYKRYAVIPFEKETYQQRLTQFGLQIGVGYLF